MDRLYFWIIVSAVVYVLTNYMLHKFGYYYDGEERTHDDKT